MINLLIFLIVIGLLIFIHECGHFFSAKLFKIRVETFAIGFGPTIISFRRNNTDYKINLFPLGGYVKLFGEDDSSIGIDDESSFNNQKWYKKFIVIVSGVLMNFFLACLIYSIILFKSSFIQYLPYIPGISLNLPFGTTTNITGFQVNLSDKSSPIYKSGLRGSYVFLKINDKNIYLTEDVIYEINKNKGKKTKFTIASMNDNKITEINIIPRENTTKDKGALGVLLLPTAQISFNGLEKPFAGILYSADMFKYNISSIYDLTNEAIKVKQASVVTNVVTGPIGIYEITGEVYQSYGLMGVLNVVALLSLALAFMNILPVPVLDGGAAVFILYESAFRRKINTNLKAGINNIGAIILIILTIFIMYNDVKNFDIINKIINIFHK